MSEVFGSPLAITTTATLGKNRDMTGIDVADLARRRLEWLIAEVREVAPETPRVKSIKLLVRRWQTHLPGQHVDVRLTAEDGYQAQRSYSIASPPDDEFLTLTVEEVVGGEISPYLVGDIRPGDRFELRGPIGGYFVWTADVRGPLSLIAGGSGIVPLMAMLRHRDRQNIRVPALLLYSSRTLEDIIYQQELDKLTDRDPALRVVNTLTRKQPDDWKGHRGRFDKAFLAEQCFPPDKDPKIFVCGPTGFVEQVSAFLAELGHNPRNIKTERFGPSGV
jgi:ferredoxin-NADP reductase